MSSHRPSRAAIPSSLTPHPSSLPEPLFQHFDSLADRPEAVAKLRELVLSLATQGRLVPQNPTDDSAESLLDQIDAERARRVAAKNLGASPRMKVIALPDSLLPRGWTWAPFGQVTFCRDGERIPVSSAERETLAKTYDYYGASGVIDKIDRYLFDRPLLLIGEDGANLVNRSTPIAFIAEGKYWINNHAHVLDGIDRTLLDYLCIFINSINLEPYLTGMAQPKMNQAQMNSIPVALPPLAEQRRIVAKVGELLALCDALEARQTAAREHRARLVHSALDHLAAAKDEEDFQKHISFILHNSSLILEDVPSLRQAILSLAVQGKLVPQDPSDKPADRALRLCGVDMARWSVTKDEERNTVPDSWAWIRFAGVGELRLGKMLDAQKNRGESRPYLRNTNVQWMRFELDDVKEMRVEAREEDELCLREGDLLICEGGEPGRCAIWHDEAPEMYFQKALHRVRPCDAVLPGFLALNLQIDCRNGVLASYFTGATIKHLTGRSLLVYPIPVPPLAEQQRIVAKVEELMRWCDQLEAHLATARTAATHLLDATLKKLLEGER